MELAQDLTLSKVAALYDKGEAEQKEFNKVEKKFDKYKIIMLPTEDIRDKKEKSKIGCFDSKGNLKDEYKKEFENIMINLIDWFSS